jgi:hypothetical protein
MKPILFGLFLVIAACGKPNTTPSPAVDREVSLLEANDPALREVLFAAAKFVFNVDSNGGHGGGFGSVYVNKRPVPSLTKDIDSYINRAGLSQSPAQRSDCEAEPVTRPAPPRAPTVPASQTGGDPNPPSQPTRTTAPELCKGRSYGVINFTSVRIASDTAYVEIQFGGGAVGGITRCLPLVVDQVAGGWIPADVSVPFSRMKSSKTGQCGK